MPGESGTKPGAANGGAENWNMGPDARNTAENEKSADKRLEELFSKVALKVKFDWVDEICEKNNIPKVQSLEDIKSWSDENKLALVELIEGYLTRIEEAKARLQNKQRQEPAPVATNKQAVETEAAAAGTQEKEEEVDPESVGKLTKLMRTKMGRKAIAAALAGATGVGLLAGALMLKSRKTEEPSPTETQQEMAIGDEADAEADAGGAEDMENMERYHFANNYSYFNDLEAKRGPHSFMNAADFIEDLVESGDIEVVENESGELEFADRDAAYRVVLYETIRMNKEQAADYLANMCAAGYFQDIFPNGCSLTEAESYLEGLSEEESVSFLQRMDEILAGASFEEVALVGEQSGTYNNSMIEANNGTAENSEDAQLRFTRTYENGTEALAIVFENGNRILTKVSLENATITRNENGDIDITLRDANGHEYRYCVQCISRNQRIIVGVPPITNDEPEEVTETPTVTPTPTPGGGGGGGGGEEGKTDFDQELVDAGLDGLTVTPLDQAGEVSVAPAEVTPMPVETPANELTPEQVEAAVDGGWNGEITSNQDNRTEENTANIAAENAADEAAIRNYIENAPSGTWTTVSPDDLGNIYSSGDF